MELLIFTDDNPTPRIRYTMEFVFCYVLKIKHINFTSDLETFVKFDGWKLNYSNTEFLCPCLNTSPSGLLTNYDFKKADIKIGTKESLPYLIFKEQQEADPFSLIFFMISRYEEYWSFEEDVHSRFPASESIAHQNDFLEFPIVDAWIDWIRKQMNELFPKLPPIKLPNYSFTPTYDIDHVRAYLWKGPVRTLGGIGKSLWSKDGSFYERMKILLGKKKDTYDVFELLDDWHEKYRLNPNYFWLLGDFGTFDKNPSYQHPRFREEIRKLAKQYDTGIHPSYQSFLNKEQVKKEITRLQDIISAHRIEMNRFHFLRFRLPDSYRILEELGIVADYSMAFPDALGFRAGTSHPFYWYDLEKEKITSLKVYPFQIMDVSLKNYLGLSPEESIEKTAKIISHIRRYGGHFISLWHNSSFDKEEWDGWKLAYEEILKMGKV